MPRLFIGLEIPQNIATSLSTIRGGVAGARWIEPESYHITLRFLGEVDRHQNLRIRDQLEQLECEPVSIQISGLDSFGNNRNPRAIYAKVVSSLPLVQLQKQLERYMQLLGFDPVHRHFTPHITLARLKRARIQEVGLFCAQHTFSISEEFTATHLALYSAKALTGGGPYVMEERYEFTG